ncbi:MAG: FixH family protein [Thermoleophilia bacterium]|nr:FixH family protein [Thermoleophilia bacterium]
MRKALLAGALVAALALPAPASAGCWATVELVPPPKSIQAGQTWNAELTVLQHGRTPLPDAKPTVTVVNASTGERRTFPAKATDAARGRFEANVVFPTAGTWRYEVFDGFTSIDGRPVRCGKTHSFAPLDVAPGGGGTTAASSGARPLWPLAAGLSALLVAVAAALVIRVRRGGSKPAPA